GRITTLELTIRRAGDRRSGGVHEREVLDAGGAVAAAVGRGPGPIDAGEAGATGLRSSVGERDRHRRLAIVAGGGRAGAARVGRVTALELPVGRAGDRGRGGVHERDVLDAGGGVAAAVGRGPGAVDPRYAGATGRRSCIGEGDRDRRGAVVGGSGRAGAARI